MKLFHTDSSNRLTVETTTHLGCLLDIEVLSPHLTDENCEERLPCAAHKTKRELKGLVAEIAPKPNVAARIRKVPERCKNETPPKQEPWRAASNDAVFALRVEGVSISARRHCLEHRCPVEVLFFTKVRNARAPDKVPLSQAA